MCHSPRMRFTIGIFVLLVICASLLPARAHADAIVVTRAMLASTIAEIFVEEDTVRVEIAIGLTDIEAFRNIMPDEIYRRLGFPA